MNNSQVLIDDRVPPEPEEAFEPEIKPDSAEVYYGGELIDVIQYKGA